jgi:hypothetical protein
LQEILSGGVGLVCGIFRGIFDAETTHSEGSVRRIDLTGLGVEEPQL